MRRFGIRRENKLRTHQHHGREVRDDSLRSSRAFHRVADGFITCSMSVSVHGGESGFLRM